MVGVALLVKDDRGLLSVDKDATTMSRFLNRILGISVRLQNKLFAYFTDTLSAIIQHAKKIGRWDGGILGEIGRYMWQWEWGGGGGGHS